MVVMYSYPLAFLNLVLAATLVWMGGATAQTAASIGQDTLCFVATVCQRVAGAVGVFVLVDLLLQASGVLD